MEVWCDDLGSASVSAASCKLAEMLGAMTSYGTVQWGTDSVWEWLNSEAQNVSMCSLC